MGFDDDDFDTSGFDLAKFITHPSEDNDTGEDSLLMPVEAIPNTKPDMGADGSPSLTSPLPAKSVDSASGLKSTGLSIPLAASGPSSLATASHSPTSVAGPKPVSAPSPSISSAVFSHGSPSPTTSVLGSLSISTVKNYFVSEEQVKTMMDDFFASVDNGITKGVVARIETLESKCAMNYVAKGDFTTALSGLETGLTAKLNILETSLISKLSELEARQTEHLSRLETDFTAKFSALDKRLLELDSVKVKISGLETVVQKCQTDYAIDKSVFDQGILDVAGEMEKIKNTVNSNFSAFNAVSQVQKTRLDDFKQEVKLNDGAVNEQFKTIGSNFNAFEHEFVAQRKRLDALESKAGSALHSASVTTPASAMSGGSPDPTGATASGVSIASVTTPASAMSGGSPDPTGATASGVSIASVTPSSPGPAGATASGVSIASVTPSSPGPAGAAASVGSSASVTAPPAAIPAGSSTPPVCESDTESVDSEDFSDDGEPVASPSLHAFTLTTTTTVPGSPAGAESDTAGSSSRPHLIPDPDLGLAKIDEKMLEKIDGNVCQKYIDFMIKTFEDLTGERTSEVFIKKCMNHMRINPQPIKDAKKFADASMSNPLSVFMLAQCDGKFADTLKVISLKIGTGDGDALKDYWKSHFDCLVKFSLYFKDEEALVNLKKEVDRVVPLFMHVVPSV